jgi:hypothetical protein
MPPRAMFAGFCVKGIEMVTGRYGCDDGGGSVGGHIAEDAMAGRTLPDHAVGLTPLVGVLGEIRGLQGLLQHGQISAAEYERRRRRLLEKI